ncbi:hypothetical protein HK100_007431 [Physocladia obscura]|uniref:Uncharacterized protein n=1 Tax=Physocladia obscura TaxID=109957 RepID=A0AAD5T4P1_9FUNG|nr:hypothetical protein HK100_007431 [Physocladia obscura]
MQPQIGLTSDIRLLRSVVGMLTARLPINSGTTLAQLEGDALFTKNIRALIELCPWRMWDVLGAIGAVLEAVPAPTPPTRAHFPDDVVSLGEASAQAQTQTQSPNVNSNANSNSASGNAIAGTGNSGNANNNVLNVAAQHSQLLVLRLMANCLAYYWRLYRDTHPLEGADGGVNNGLGGDSGGNSGLNSNTGLGGFVGGANSPSLLSSPSPSISFSASGSSASFVGAGLPLASALNSALPLPSALNSTLSSAAALTHPSPALPNLSDPPALDESLANYLLNTVSQLLQTSSLDINVDSISHPDFLRSMGFHDDKQTSPVQLKLASFFTAPSSSYLPNPSLFVAPAQSEIYLELQKETGKIIFYLSASNWPLVINRLRAKIYSLTSFSSATQSSFQNITAAAPAASASPYDLSDNANFDLSELRYLEFLNLNVQRLPTLLTGTYLSNRIKCAD